MKGLRRDARPDLARRRGGAAARLGHHRDGQVVGGTRDALYVPQRLPWEQLEAADWDSETSELRVSEVGSWGAVRPEHRFAIEEPGRLLELVRERVTASVLLQRHVPINGRRGVRVIARRAPGVPSEISWIYEYDEGDRPRGPAGAAGRGRGPGRRPRRGRARLRDLDFSPGTPLANVSPHDPL